MIAIDNIATPYRLFNTESVEKRLRVINKLGRDLRFMASQLDCAVLVVNQMTTKITSGYRKRDDEENEDSFSEEKKLTTSYQIAPSLGKKMAFSLGLVFDFSGKTWENHVDTRIILGSDGRNRYTIHIIYHFFNIFRSFNLSFYALAFNPILSKEKREVMRHPILYTIEVKLNFIG